MFRLQLAIKLQWEHDQQSPQARQAAWVLHKQQLVTQEQYLLLLLKADGRPWYGSFSFCFTCGDTGQAWERI